MFRNSFCCFSGEVEAAGKSNKSCDHPWDNFTLKELLQATNNFHADNKLGEGSFGTVYWGRTSNGSEIAVKRLKGMTAKAEMDFAMEVEILGRVHHKNLLGLRGFYARGDERLIVYDYMPNHSLLRHLHGHRAGDVLLDWPRRMSIAIGSAEGLAYLHHEAIPHITHRDVKASNMLLDSDFSPKVADFGLAKLMPERGSYLTTLVKGTLGYLAPEYAMWGKVSNACDVFSFGILLLEIISARKPIEKLPGGVKRDIVRWATPFVQSGALEQLADPRLGQLYSRAQLRTAVEVATRCTDANTKNRPTMKKIVELLRDGVAETRPKEMKHVNESGEEDHPGISQTSPYAKTSWRMSRMR